MGERLLVSLFVAALLLWGLRARHGPGQRLRAALANYYAAQGDAAPVRLQPVSAGATPACADSVSQRGGRGRDPASGVRVESRACPSP